MSDYRQTLFDQYDLHAASLDGDESVKRHWFQGYVAANYLPHLEGLDRDEVDILEIGCSKGYLLATLRDLGFRRLKGIDLSPGDILEARRLVPEATAECISAKDYLDAHPNEFDAIFMKAVLEHTLKADVVPLLTAIAASLRKGGVAIIDVPSMDWLFAGHERYMDFTHEVGFTRESLQQTVGSIFTNVTIAYVDNTIAYERASHGRGGSGRSIRGHRWRTRFARRLLGTLFTWADPQGGTGAIWARGIIAVARK